jgi:hypothetical protein
LRKGIKKAPNMNTAAGGSALIIVIFLSLDEQSQDFGYKNQANTGNKPVNSIKFRRGFPWKMAVFGNEKIYD